METTGNSTPAETLETLDCPICFEKFNSPRILPCLHTVCEKCLGIHIRQHDKGRCPLCHAQIILSDIKRNKDKSVSEFPLNELINSLIDSRCKSDNDDNFCEPCSERKQNASSEYWCINCQERLCNSCYECHKHMKQSKNHRMVPIDEKKHNIRFNITFDQNCVKHHGHKLETFCLNHRALCCGVCYATIHRNCGDIRDINSAAEDQAKRCTYRNVINQFSKIKTEIDKILSDKSNNRSQLQTEREQIIENIDIRIDQIINKLNELRVYLKTETEHLYEEANSLIVESEKQIKAFQTNVTNTQQILESIQNEIATREKFLALEILRSQVASHYEQLKLTAQEDVEIHLSLKAITALRDFEDLSSLDAIQTSSKQPESLEQRLKNVDAFMKNLFYMSKLSTATSSAQIAKRDPMTSQVTFVKAVTSQTYGGYTWFMGSAVLPDGRLLMADSNNRRLVQLDEEFNIVEEYELDGRPTDVAAGQSNNQIYIAVCQPVGNYVYKCTLDNGLTIVGRIQAPLYTNGITVSGENIIVGTIDAVVILNQDGTTAKSIPKSGFDCYVTVLSQKMYHNDKNDIVCRTLEGSELFRYQHQQLREPRGISIDTHGCTYICGCGSNNIHQVSPDGKKSRILELHTISRPLCCIFLPQQNELLVTSGNEETALEVYKLK